MSRMSGCSSGGSSASISSSSGGGGGVVAGAVGASSSADNTLSSLSGNSAFKETTGVQDLFAACADKRAPPPAPPIVTTTTTTTTTSIISAPGGHAGRAANHVTIAGSDFSAGEDGRRSARVQGTAPLVEPPRKASLFSNFKIKSKKESPSPRDSSFGATLTSTAAAAAAAVGGRQYLTVGPGASTSFGLGASYRQQNDQQSSPRLFSNILDHFRQKSKTMDGSKSSKKKFIVKPVSENEHKTDLLTRVKGFKMKAEEMRRQKMASDMLSVYATIHGGMRPPMTTIPSVDEDSKMDSSCVALPTPLFVDTHLANHEASASTSTWRQKANSLSARNALGSLGFGRHHKEKSLQQQQHDHRKRSASGNAEGQQTETRQKLPYHKTSSLMRKKLRIPRSRKSVPHASSSARCSPYRAQRSLDSSGAESYPTSRIYFSQSANESGAGLGWFDVMNDNSDQLFYNLLFTHIFQVLPTSGKVVVFDVNLPVKKAFYALVYNSVRAATLVDEQQRFVETQASNDRRWQKFLYIDVNQNLHRAVRQLLTHKIHRLAVVCPQTNNMLYVLTLKRILRYLSIYLIKTPYNLLPPFVHQTPKSLDIGTYEDLVTIRYETPLSEALSLFLQRKISALPILNDQDQVKDIYCKFDAINLVANNAFANLDLTLGEALRHRRRSAPGVDPATASTSAQQQQPSSKPSPIPDGTNVISCPVDASLWRVITTLTQNEIHRVLILDENLRLKGIVSLSDIFAFLKEPLRAVSPGHAAMAAADPATAGDLWAETSGGEQRDNVGTSDLLLNLSITPPTNVNLVQEQIMEEEVFHHNDDEPSSPRPETSS